MHNYVSLAVAGFFDAFVEAFKTFDGAVIAARYASPYTAIKSDGGHIHLGSPAETAGYFQEFLDDYYAKGCRACGYKWLEVAPLNEGAFMATVTWELYNSAGGVISSWRESYQLAYAGERLVVFASIDHAA